MSGHRFIPVWTLIAQRRAAANARFIVLGLTITGLFMGSLTRQVWRNSAKVKGSERRRGWSVYDGQVCREPASSCRQATSV